MLKKIFSIIKSIFVMLRICKKSTNENSSELTLIPAARTEAPCKLIKCVGNYTSAGINWLVGDYWLSTFDPSSPRLWRREASGYFVEEAPKAGFFYLFCDSGELYTWNEETESFMAVYIPDYIDDLTIKDSAREEFNLYMTVIVFRDIVDSSEIEIENNAPDDILGTVVYASPLNMFLLEDLTYPEEPVYYKAWTASLGIYSSSLCKNAIFARTDSKFYLITENGLIG